MRSSLERRILIFSFLALTLTLAVNTGFNVESFRRSYRDGILQRAQTLATGLKTQTEAVLRLGLPLEEISGLAERCQDIVSQDPQIAYCIIENKSGAALYHSSDSYPNTANLTFAGTLSADVSILDSTEMGRLYDYAAPLYDFDDRIVGRVRIGMQDKVLSELVLGHLKSSALILIIAFAIVFSLVFLFSRYDLILPIRRLCDMARELASGRFDTKVPVLRSQELALLGSTLKDMAASLQQRDEQLRRNYQELEVANLELKSSYENLESLSSELGRSREMYRLLLDEASDAILVCDNHDKLILVNKAAERFFGQSKSRMEGNNYFSFLEQIKCRDVEHQFEAYQSVTPQHSTATELRFWRDADKRGLFGMANTSAVVGRDGKQLMQIVVRDVTREEEIRQGLERAASEMERLNQMKNSFLGLASHELKTPLTIIMGYVELLLSGRDMALDDDALALVRHISRAGDRLSEIVRDMVDVSLLDGRTVELVSREVDINTLVQRAVDRNEAAVRQRNQVLSLALGRDLPLVKCDVERMVQAIGNVLGNAIKFSPDNKRITVQTQLVFRPRRPDKFSINGFDGSCAISANQTPYIEITISDKGIGIAEAEQEAIFDKFHEVGELEEHSTGKVAFKSRGAGLGLSIVKGIVDLHGGAVWVESPGYDPVNYPGSTFFILLPTVVSEA